MLEKRETTWERALKEFDKRPITQFSLVCLEVIRLRMPPRVALIKTQFFLDEIALKVCPKHGLEFSQFFTTLGVTPQSFDKRT